MHEGYRCSICRSITKKLAYRQNDEDNLETMADEEEREDHVATKATTVNIYTVIEGLLPAMRICDPNSRSYSLWLEIN